ncbi:hypothetical protein AB0C02_31295 [Micromonospora sp. NPDC048999]|uniref:hypothetical protein n=1 Tax=Micromonospora sp. NPDC048999 TaxID=3155391 RepID=UPI003410504E
MTTILVASAVAVVLVAAAVGYVSWRDRRRSTPDEDRAATRSAQADQQRYERERHGLQADTVRRNQFSSGGG